MTETNTVCFEELKTILKNIRSPELLDDHPWSRSLIVEDTLTQLPHLTMMSPGQQLVAALADLFSKMQPPAPPRRGKRLDPRWGEFGLLAAFYFVPFDHGLAFPTSLMDAWERIDAAILYSVYGKSAQRLTPQEIERYQLVGDEIEYGSASTLSDWHKKGLQRLTEILLNRERFLSNSLSKPSVILRSNGSQSSLPEPLVRSLAALRKYRPVLKRSVAIIAALSLVLALVLGLLKARRIYSQGMLIYTEVTSLRGAVTGSIAIEDINAMGPRLKTLQNDLNAFEEEVHPWLWMAPRLSWMPTYGGDLASAPELLGLAEHLVSASNLSYQAAQPLLNEFNAQSSRLESTGLTSLLVQAQPQLAEARLELDQALAARGNIKVQDLSPRLENLIKGELDPVLKLADDGLTLAMALPGVLGAAKEGPKTYLLLVQNEDELRPTGGFITSVGNLVIANGRIIDMKFEEAGELEDWSKPYPAAPWQLQQYMNSPVLVLRDSNWFVNFPTTAQWAEYLYAYTHAHSVDGVIAFDQHFLVMLLGQIGPLEVEGAPYPITDKNVIDYMRQAKAPPAGEPIPADWYRKEFIGDIANAVLKVFSGGQSHDWRGITQMSLQALNERHLLLQLDEPHLAGLIAEQGWDNAVQPGEGDFLMVTDTNIGFNKTNAVVETRMSYDVDLTDILAPMGTLLVTHQNNANPDVPCIQWHAGQITEEKYYPIDRCYWNYLRLYKQAGVNLLDASPHSIPGSWMILGEAVPARVDDLDEELQGIQGFGTLMVVPGGQSINTSFKFALPLTVLDGEAASHQLTYRLTVQKQPGTLAVPLTLRIHLPNRAVVKSTSLDVIAQDNHLLINTDLQTDVELEIVFELP